jgi:mxaA protein
MKRFALGLAFLFWMGVALAADIEIRAQNPRPFGYVVGDVFEQELILSAKAGQRLDQKQLPKPGRLNAWLELRNLTIDESSSGATTAYRVRLTYQLPNAPVAVRVIELPAQRFVLLQADTSIEVNSTEWPITIGPITPDEVLARDGLEAMRADAPPTLIDTTAVKQRLVGYAVALAALLLYWCYRYFGIPYLNRQRRPFTRAYREVDKLVRSAEPSAYHRALEHLHRALNETAGKSLFVDNIDPFLANRSIPSGLAAMTREFFQASRNEFFAGGGASGHYSIAWMQDFCRAWRDVERGVA